MKTKKPPTSITKLEADLDSVRMRLMDAEQIVRDLKNKEAHFLKNIQSVRQMNLQLGGGGLVIDYDRTSQQRI